MNKGGGGESYQRWGGGVQNRFWGGVLCYVLSSPEFSIPPLIFFLRDLGFPRPQTAARIPISWKRGFRGPKTPIFPSPRRTWEFSVQKKRPLSYKVTQRKRGLFARKLAFPACVRATGKDPETLLSRKWGFPPQSGVGGIPMKDFLRTPF